MPWFKVDDGFCNSRQVMRIPKRQRAAAVGLWTLAGAWSAKELTDGFIPGYMLSELTGTARLAGELVASGLWEVDANGFVFVNWSKYQPTGEQVRSDRRREANKKRTQRRAKDGRYGCAEEIASTSDDGNLSLGDIGGTPTGTTSGTPSGSRSVPTRPDPLLIKDSLIPAPDGFAEFWVIYPKKADKGAARRAWAKATNAGVEPSVIIAGAERYRDDKSRKDQFTKNPATWLNAESWDNESTPPPRLIAGGRWEEI